MSQGEVPLAGVQVIQGRSHVDDRGGFTRVADLWEFHVFGLRPDKAQLAYASNRRKGTIRGMHFQIEPYSEKKLIWCVNGIVFDVLLDIRPTSPTYGKWAAIRLEAEDAVSLFVPPGVAHGYQCLTDDATLCYLIDGPYHPEYARTVRWSDSTVGIEWPLAVTAVSAQDELGSPWPPDF